MPPSAAYPRKASPTPRNAEDPQRRDHRDPPQFRLTTIAQTGVQSSVWRDVLGYRDRLLPDRVQVPCCSIRYVAGAAAR